MVVDGFEQLPITRGSPLSGIVPLHLPATIAMKKSTQFFLIQCQNRSLQPSQRGMSIDRGAHFAAALSY